MGSATTPADGDRGHEEVMPDAPVSSSVIVRFSGDAGDGMLLAGSQFGRTAARIGDAVCSLPDFPAEIRSPVGTLSGVTGIQVRLSREPIHCATGQPDALVAMNPAALRANLADLKPGGVLLIDAQAFHPEEWAKAGYAQSPLTDGSLASYRLVALPITQLNREAVAALKLVEREADRSRNFFALGLVYQLFDRPIEPSLEWIRAKFANHPDVLRANSKALKAGFHHPLPLVLPRSAGSALAPGRYRRLTGNDAIALGLLAAARRLGRPLVFCSYPITPAVDLIHGLSERQGQGTRFIMMEDEVAALGAALGASFGGALAATATSGPGMCLKAEMLGLAVMAELPAVIINVQRGGPGVGLPSKTEQADLLQALFGRHGEAPLPVLAACSPSDGFETVYEAARIACRLMTPVIVLADFDLAYGAETWRIPDVDALPTIESPATPTRPETGAFLPFDRDEMLARPWVDPGSPGFEHRLGGLEKEDGTGAVSYDPSNHEQMVRLRAEKVANAVQLMPPLQVDGPSTGELLLVGWGGTFGPLREAAQCCRRLGLAVAHVHLRYLHPMPPRLGDVLRAYRRVLVAELNSGQLAILLRARYLVDCRNFNRIQGRSLLAEEIVQEVHRWVSAEPPSSKGQPDS